MDFFPLKWISGLSEEAITEGGACMRAGGRWHKTNFAKADLGALVISKERLT